MHMHLPITHFEAPHPLEDRDRRAMAGRHALPILACKPTKLHWEQSDPFPRDDSLRDAAKQNPNDCYFSITCAVDDREFRELEILDTNTLQCYATIELPFAAPGQVYRCALTQNQRENAFCHGLSIRLKSGTSPFWIVAPGGPNTPNSILPNLSQESKCEPLESFLSIFCTPASFQQWDWTGVCSLDGLQDWARLGNQAASHTLAQYLETFIAPKTGQRENFRSQPNDDAPASAESGGPYAILAAQSPEHPKLKLAIEGFRQNRCPRLQCVASSHIVTESNYNVAYPMMSLAINAGHEEWRERSLYQLKQTQKYLTDDHNLWLRYAPKTGERQFHNWSRGVAWYFLGLVRTLELLPSNEWPGQYVTEANRMAKWVSEYQLPTGIWAGFLHEPSILPDTSGSAGIAAAIAIGVSIGLIDSRWKPVAEAAYRDLQHYLTHDGWLKGTSQSNKPESHYMDIQRSNYRVIAPWGMGLFAQLAAAIEMPTQHPTQSLSAVTTKCTAN